MTSENETIENWLTENYPQMNMIPYIRKYMENNDEATFLEAMESTDSIVYRLWCERDD